MAPTLPFSPPKGHSHKGGVTDCPVFRLLPAPLQEESKDKGHLLEYLHALPVEDVGIPDFYPTLDRSMGDLKSPNLIYPVKDGLYIHVYPDETDIRDYYIAIEPGMLLDSEELIEEVEEHLVDYVSELDDTEGQEMDRTKVLRRILDRICVVVRPRDLAQEMKKYHKKGKMGRLPVTREQKEALRYRLIRDKERMGVLEPLIVDSYIEDISCSGLGSIFLEHKIFKSLKASISFEDERELDSFVIQLSEKIGRPVTYSEPIIDATLPDGSRINLVFGGDVSKRGSNFTIRKFAEDPLSIIQLVEFGGLTYEIAAYLTLAMEHGMNAFISGETASGKTTLINAITAFLHPSSKIVSIEDTPELQVPHPNWIREVVRGKAGEETSSVTMFDLLRAALRQRPNCIIIGEIRGAEGAIAFQAMQTGHACLATFHAATVEKLIQRLTGNPISIPKVYVENLNLVIIQSMVRLPNGKNGRRILSISEIVGYDTVTDSFSYIEVFRWNSVNDTFEFTGHMNSYLLEEVISLKVGLPPTRKREIYDEMFRRAEILSQFKDQGVIAFDDVYKTLAKAYREGIF
ncbi:MAG: type II/IV secretion system ATPase subunit [Dehalococcoidia bacterium]